MMAMIAACVVVALALGVAVVEVARADIIRRAAR